MMVEINTRDFGLIEVEDTAIYDFPEGVYGFEDDNEMNCSAAASAAERQTRELKDGTRMLFFG